MLSSDLVSYLQSVEPQVNQEPASIDLFTWLFLIFTITGTLSLISHFCYYFYLISKMYPFDMKVDIPKSLTSSTDKYKSRREYFKSRRANPSYPYSQPVRSQFKSLPFKSSTSNDSVPIVNSPKSMFSAKSGIDSFRGNLVRESFLIDAAAKDRSKLPRTGTSELIQAKRLNSKK